MKKKTIIALSVTCGFVAILFVAAMIYYFGASHPEFYNVASKAFEIPGLETKFVPQGLEYDSNSQNFLVSGYMSDGEASRIYVVDKETKKAEKFFTLSIDGVDYVGHCGGVAVDGDYAWIVGDKIVHRFSFSQALAVSSGESVAVIDSFTPGNGADFVLVNNGDLIVGEFYKEDKYETPTNHHIETSTGEINYALSYIYTIDQTKAGGIATSVPKAGISMPNQVQGMCFNKDGDIVLSTSYSIPDSKILIFENVLNGEAETSVSISEQNVPVYVLHEENLIKVIEAPAMSEELVLVDNKVYVLFESNCSKYRLVNRTRLSHVYAMEI